jgi:hypothetical protein
MQDERVPRLGLRLGEGWESDEKRQESQPNKA